MTEGCEKQPTRIVRVPAPLAAALALLLFLPQTGRLPAEASAQAGATIHYSVSVARRADHLFAVTMTVPNVHGQLTVAMPAWYGLYQIRDFAARVFDLRASLLPPEAQATGASAQGGPPTACPDIQIPWRPCVGVVPPGQTQAGLPTVVPQRGTEVGLPTVASAKVGPPRPIPVEPLDDKTWRIAADGAVRLDYDVFWNDPPPFSSQLDSHHAFVNLAEIPLYVPERRSEVTEVEFTGLAPDWKIAVELPPSHQPVRTPPAAANPASFRAPDYDALVDAPVEIGDFDELRFTVNGARLRVVVDGKAAGATPIPRISRDRAAPMKSIGADEKMLAGMIRAIVAYEIGLMQEVPFDEYLFIYHLGEGETGMEHANSAAIAVSDESHAAFVTAHEFFHVWNIKRIRPESLEPVDYSREQWTRALWFAEGVTSTFASYALVRTGLWSREDYEQRIADLITTLQARPAHTWQSVEQASLDAWLEKDPFYLRPDRSISYYNKGEILGLLLDIEIRDLTGNRKSLDDLMRDLNRSFAHQHRFYRGSVDIERAAELLTGHSFAEFFSRYVSGTAEIPYESFLRRAGLLLHSHGATFASLGFLVTPAPGGAVVVAHVIPGSAAEQAGVRPGDAILALNGEPFPYSLPTWLARRRPGETVTVLVRRGGASRTLSFPLEARSRIVYQIKDDFNATAAQLRIREGLFAGKTD